MKYVLQFGVIACVTFAGEMIKKILPLPIPASVWGLILMLVLLMTKIIKVEKVKETGDFLVNSMPIMFVPAGVGLLTSWSQLKAMLLPIVIIILITTPLVMAVAGKVTQLVIEKDKSQTHQE